MVKVNTIYCGDNLKVLKTFPTNSIDLIYIDPPFFTGTVQKLSGYSYNDKWSSLDNYLEFMRPRLKELFRVLKSTGSFYIHCGWRIAPYLRIECDKIFGYYKHMNSIVWKHADGGRSDKYFPRKHDIIYFYVKSSKYIFNIDDIFVDYESGYSGTSQVIAGVRKRYSRNPKGKIMDDVWIIPRPYGKEIVGYPTQKPMELLEIIINASSNKGDIILDIFCGSGTTCVVAFKLGRKYIGIDSNQDAVDITNKRLNNPILIESIKEKEETEPLI